MILMMIFINFLYLVYFYNNEYVYKVLCSGGPRHKPPGVSRGSPRLHFILMCMLVQLVVCCDRNKVQFNSIQKTLSPHIDISLSYYFLGCSTYITIV